MEISSIDKNFQNVVKTLKNGQLIKVPSDCVNVFGVSFNETGFYRIDENYSKDINEGVHFLSKHTAGGRIGFSTNSKNIVIHVEYPYFGAMRHMAFTGQGGMTLCEYVNGEERHVYTYQPEDKNGGYISSYLNIKGRKTRDYILHLPLYNPVKSLTIEIDKGASITPFNPYKDILPIVYYGSSITQGGCASRSDHSYQGFISKWNHIDFINLGFSGNCKAEPQMNEYLKTLNMSVFVYDYDHNAPDVDYLKATHEKFYLEFRKNHPETPIIIMSAPNYYSNPSLYKKRLDVIKNTYENAVKNGDKNVYFIDGSKIYPKSLRYECSVDDAHPTDLGFYYMAVKVNKVLKQIFED